MSGKKVSITPKPTNVQSEPNLDNWITQGKESLNDAQPTSEKIKRLTIDIPESLHRDIKSQCASRGNKIVDEIRELLEQKYRPNDG
jgi:hypothetical protein